MNNEINKIFRYLEDNFDGDLNFIRNFLRQKSVSYTGEGIKETANKVKKMIEEVGGTAKIIKTEGHPLVYGSLNEGAVNTLLIYSMYDVMPAEESDWISDPWAADMKELPELGECIIARGAVNTKGSTAAFFNAIKAYKAVKGKLPVNLIFAIEGEEEMGSVSFRHIIRNKKELFKDCDAMLFPWFGEEDGVPMVRLGTKGIIYFELEAHGGEWGGPTEHGIHGSFAAWVKNPVWRLVSALSTMIGKDETEIKIDGFYKGIEPLPQDDNEALKSSIKFMDADKWRKNYGVKKFKWALKGFKLWKKMFTTPTLNINGITGGYTGEGTKTLLPDKAVAKIDIRLVPGMDPDEMIDKVRIHLDNHGYEDIEMKVKHKYYPSKVAYSSLTAQTLIKVCEYMNKPCKVLPLSQGSAPYDIIEHELGIPYIMGGLGHGSNEHVSNEYCTVDGILDFEKSMVLFLKIFSNLAQN